MADQNVRTNVERELQRQSDALKAGHVQKFNEIDARLAAIQDRLSDMILERSNAKGIPAYAFRESEHSPDPFGVENKGYQQVATPWIFIRLVINERTRLLRFAEDYQMSEFGFEPSELLIGINKLGRKIGAPMLENWVLEEAAFSARAAQKPEIEIGKSNLQSHVDFRIQLRNVEARLIIDVEPHFLKESVTGRRAKSPVSEEELLRRLEMAAAIDLEDWDRSPEELDRIKLDLERAAQEKPPSITPKEAQRLGFDPVTSKALHDLWSPFAKDVEEIRSIYSEGINFYISEVEVDLALALVEGKGGLVSRLARIPTDEQIAALQQTGQEMITRAEKASFGRQAMLGWNEASTQAANEIGRQFSQTSKDVRAIAPTLS